MNEAQLRQTGTAPDFSPWKQMAGLTSSTEVETWSWLDKKSGSGEVPSASGFRVGAASYLAAEFGALTARPAQDRHVAERDSTSTGRLTRFYPAEATSPRESRLAELLVLHRDWDGRGSAPPSVNAVARALQLMRNVDRIGIEVAGIAPSPDEGVAINYLRGGRAATLEIMNSGEVFCTCYGRGVEASVHEVSLANTEATLCRLTDWLKRT